MEGALQSFYSLGLSTSTQKSYSTGQKRFLSFCKDHSLSPLPPSEHTILLFLAQLGLDGLSLATMQSYMSAIRNLLVHNGLSSFDLYTPKVKLVLRGIKRWKASALSNPLPRLPITPDILLQLKNVWSRQPISHDHLMLWAAVCTGFFGFLQSAEFTVPSLTQYDPSRHLSFRDVHLPASVPISTISITIKHSKTDQFYQGIDIFLSRTKASLCPVSALLDYLSIRGKANGPLFLLASGKPLSREVLVTEVRSALSRAGLNALDYCSHSFRIGAATTALKAGISDAKIRMLGRWESDAYQLYLRTPREELASVCSSLANCHS